ncbi:MULTISPECIES: hypothetical protein [Pseudomonas]|uniref:LamG domain-containing protein n=1 Tax=Pseudomonas putida TaxID=303 RepID=A0A1L7NEQ9_PSEPU|nr:hypothetical protein [Pseudomonas putida]BAW23947.1 hypothetical protein KF715C_ch33740 [Pseudomonas putida]
MPRSILTFPGSASVPGLPKLDVSEAEINVANIAGLKHWPGLFDWDVASGSILDRVTDGVIPSYGVSQPGANFVTMVNGKKGYKINALANTLVMPGFDTSGSFTVGCVCGIDLTFGSFTETELNTSVPAPWGMYSDVSPTGQISAVFGSISIASSVSATWPIKLAADKLTAVVIIFDRGAGKLSIRYNGIEMYANTVAAIKTVSMHKELMMGGMRTAGTGRAISTRAMSTNAFAAFETALKGEDLIALESMLLEAAAAA